MSEQGWALFGNNWAYIDIGNNRKYIIFHVTATLSDLTLTAATHTAA